jgi:chromosome segregation ATPase
MTIKKYKTPVSKLIRFFEKSRDKWRTKTKEAKYQIKLLRKKNKYLEKKKNIYKAHNKELKSQLQEMRGKKVRMQEEIDRLKKKQSR